MEEAKKVAETVQLLRDLVKDRHGEEAYLKKIEIYVKDYYDGEYKFCADTEIISYEFSH